jgi:hypothetical protein
VTTDRSELAAGLVEEFLGSRLDAAGEVPGLREATVELLAKALTDDTERFIQSQLEQLRHPSSRQIPDAYFVDEVAAEGALQHAAAGIRAALARNGTLVDGRMFERRAAVLLRDDPRLAVRAELARVPRPLTRPELLRWSLDPAPWSGESADGLWPPPGLEATTDQRRLPGGSAALARVGDGPRAGWVQIGLFERHATPASRYPRRPGRQVLIAVGLEITDNEPPAGPTPFTSAPWQLWTVPWRQLDSSPGAATAAEGLATHSRPLVAVTDGGHTDPNHRRTGLGTPPFLLAPVLDLIVALDLKPTPGVCGLSLSDADGPGLLSRQWRGHLVHDGSYQPLTPAVEGTDLLLRPDLFTRLRETVTDSRIQAGISVTRQTGRRAIDDE